ncbi:MAG: SEL1-like repeat protein [bacterium]
MKKYIKMNKNNQHLSLGNFCDLIKEISTNKNAAVQSQIACSIFNIDSISDTAMNNYCVGIRRIGDDYKEIYIKFKSNFLKNNTTMIPVIFSLKNILNGKHISPLANDFDNIKIINEDEKIIELSKKLFSLAKNDKSVPIQVIKQFKSFILNNQYYLLLSEILFYIILEKKQPIYENDDKIEIINKVIENTKISSDDLSKFLNLKFSEEINYHYKLTNLAKENNPYALMELGIYEIKGYITGERRPQKAYEYFKIAASFDHPNALFMKVKIGIKYLHKTNQHADLEKAINLGSVAALNLLALCYKNGDAGYEKNIDKAIDYFNLAASKNYAYAYNNLGKIYEENNEMNEAINCYEQSANLFESYGCNKLGIHKFNNKNYKESFDYFNLGINTEINICCYFNYYNLAKFFYLNGFEELNIAPNESLAIKYLEIASRYNNYPSLIELIKIYLDKFMIENSEYYKILFYNTKYKIELHKDFNKNDKKLLEEYINKINNKLLLQI